MLLTLTLLVGCTTGRVKIPTATQSTSTDEPSSVSTENHKLIGKPLPIPTEYTQETGEQGEAVRLEYTITDYTSSSRSLGKYACVYLPYGFNATDPETQYDVCIFSTAVMGMWSSILTAPDSPANLSGYWTT